MLSDVDSQNNSHLRSQFLLLILHIKNIIGRDSLSFSDFWREQIVESKPDISVVIPAFNESKRLPIFLNELIEHCKESQRTYEIIIVDDGSSDHTAEVALEFQHAFPSLFVYKLETNRGKGYAVKYGFFRCRGNICLFMDADGSTPPSEIERNLFYLDEGYDIFVGSRVLRGEGQLLEIRLHRKALGKAFNFLVNKILSTEIKDTQCGFKIFKKEIINPLFSRMNINGFGFDLEILYLAHKMGYKVKEGPVSWKHVKGSKINLFADSAKMFANIIQVRIWHCTPINPEGLHLGRNEYSFMFEMENDHWWFVSRNKFVLRLIESMGRPFPLILDAGSGTGVNLSSLSKLGDAFGIDISLQAIHFCRKRKLRNLVRGSLEQIGFKEKTFDLITCLDVLEHIVDPLRTLGELKRILKDSGKMIITVPAFHFLWSRHDEALSHLRRYTKEDLRREMHEAGIQIDKMGYFFFASFFAVAPIRIIRKIFPAKSSPRSDTTTMPPRFLNRFLKILFGLEMKITETIRLPLGTTLYAVVSKGSTDLHGQRDI